MLWSVLCLLGFLSTTAVQAEFHVRFTQEQQIVNADYVMLLNRYYFLGCTTMGVTGIFIGSYFLWGLGSAVWVSSGLVGCGLGLLAGPIGLIIHDVTVGDTTVKRYIQENLFR